jgi:hypothetical protein
MSTGIVFNYYYWTKLGDIYVDADTINRDFLIKVFNLLNEKVLNVSNNTDKTDKTDKTIVNVEYYTEPNELSYTEPPNFTELPDTISFKISYKHNGITTTIKRFFAFKKNIDTNLKNYSDIKDFSVYYDFSNIKYQIKKNLPLLNKIIEPTADNNIYDVASVYEKTPDAQTQDDNSALPDVINREELDKYIDLILNNVSKEEINQQYALSTKVPDYTPPVRPTNLLYGFRFVDVEKETEKNTDIELAKWQTEKNKYDVNYIRNNGLRTFAIKNYYYRINNFLIKPGQREFRETKVSTIYDSYKPKQIIGGKNLKVKNNEPKYKEILGKRMKIYKIADSRKEYVKYKKELISISDYKKLVKLKAKTATKQVTKPTSKSTTKSKAK